MKFYKKYFLSIFDWISLLVSLGLIVFIVLFVSLSKRNYTSLQSSINILSQSGETVNTLQRANHNLLLSENNFRIFINTGDVKYKNKFLSYIFLTISELKQIQQSDDRKKIDSIILALRKDIQFAGIIEYLKNLSDSVSNNAIKINPLKYKNLNFKSIDESDLEKYIKTDTVKIDSSINIRKRGLLSWIFSGKKNDIVKINVTKELKSDSIYEMKNIRTDNKGTINTQNRKVDSLVNYIEQFYKFSINEEIKVRQVIAEKEKRIAENNLFIIDNIDMLLQQVIHSVQKEKEIKNKGELNNALTINSSNLKQTWWTFTTILFAVMILLITLMRVVKKTNEINIKNEILRKKNDVNFRLISIINHDIIAPLRLLNMVSKSLAEKSNVISEDLKNQVISEIVNVSGRLEMITGNVLNWIKYQNQNRIQPKEDIGIYEMVNEIFTILDPLAKQNKVILKNYLPTDIVVRRSPEPLRIILYNLILNALKFSNDADVIVNSYKNNNELVLTVKDEGVGMTNEQIRNILNDEFIISSIDVNNNKGNGLGFLIIKDLVNFINATITIQSKKNEGTIISVIFPD